MTTTKMPEWLLDKVKNRLFAQGAHYEKDKDRLIGMSVEACFQELTKSVGEFDEEAAYKFFQENLSDHDEVSLGMCAIEMARWQHSQDVARIEAINADRHLLDEANIKLNYDHEKALSRMREIASVVEKCETVDRDWLLEVLKAPLFEERG